MGGAASLQKAMTSSEDRTSTESRGHQATACIHQCPRVDSWYGGDRVVRLASNPIPNDSLRSRSTRTSRWARGMGPGSRVGVFADAVAAAASAAPAAATAATVASRVGDRVLSVFATAEADGFFLNELLRGAVAAVAAAAGVDATGGGSATGAGAGAGAGDDVAFSVGIIGGSCSCGVGGLADAAAVAICRGDTLFPRETTPVGMVNGFTFAGDTSTAASVILVSVPLESDDVIRKAAVSIYRR